MFLFTYSFLVQWCSHLPREARAVELDSQAVPTSSGAAPGSVAGPSPHAPELLGSVQQQVWEHAGASLSALAIQLAAAEQMERISAWLAFLRPLPQCEGQQSAYV